eukprot:374208-Pelagomonas_calceolata.AAC.2
MKIALTSNCDQPFIGFHSPKSKMHISLIALRRITYAMSTIGQAASKCCSQQHKLNVFMCGQQNTSKANRISNMKGKKKTPFDVDALLDIGYVRSVKQEQKEQDQQLRRE